MESFNTHSFALRKWILCPVLGLSFSLLIAISAEVEMLH